MPLFRDYDTFINLTADLHLEWDLRVRCCFLSLLASS